MNKMAYFTLRHVSKNFGLKVTKYINSSKITHDKKSFSSALYIPGSKASKIFAFLTPDLDFNERFSDLDKLQKELDLRSVKIDAKELQKNWSYYEYVVSNRKALENKISQLGDQIKNINKNENITPEDQEKIDALVLQIKIMKQDLRTIKESIWELEESVIPQALKLPSELDNDTPHDNSLVLKVAGEKTVLPDNKKQNHINIGKNLDLLDYISPVHCFLCNEAVAFELGILSVAGEILNQNCAMRIAGPDFCKSIVVEGCGINHESSAETFILQSTDDVDKDHLVNRLHLVGGASLPALISMFVKQTLNYKYFPIKVFNTGRQYIPFPNTSGNYGLFSLSQASVVQALTLIKNKNCDEYQTEFKNLIEVTNKIYGEIGCHYRIVMRSAKELLPYESKRVSFEMYSTYLDQYVEVGYISACGDYISKRLLIGTASNKTDYSALITGTLLNVPRILGCLLEENPNKFTLPEKMNNLVEVQVNRNI